MESPAFDVLVFGATSFVGRILCRHLMERHGTNGELRWAAAGRSQAKLEALRGDLGAGASTLTLLDADATDEASLRKLCTGARVVISTVGPYALYGESLVRACAATGTDYCDITGEVHWIRRMIERYERAARDSGARLVHCCGFDAIPSDLGVFHLQQEAVRRFGKPCAEIKMRVKTIRGGVSGGTFASLLNGAREAAASPELRRELADPYSLCPLGAEGTVRQSNVLVPRWDAQFGARRAPFAMATINTRIVHRSNALQSQAYGSDFRYDEAVLTGGGAKGRLTALATTVGLGALMFGVGLAPTRWLLAQLGPGPGEGPSPEDQHAGCFDIRFLGVTDDGRSLQTRVTADRYSGYGATARMLGEAGVCLAHDVSKAALAGGFWTPATAFGDQLRGRLEAYAGMTFEVVEGPTAATVLSVSSRRP